MSDCMDPICGMGNYKCSSCRKDDRIGEWMDALEKKPAYRPQKEGEPYGDFVLSTDNTYLCIVVDNSGASEHRIVHYSHKETWGVHPTNERVTHWMPLPDPPEGDKDDE